MSRKLISLLTLPSVLLILVGGSLLLLAESPTAESPANQRVESVHKKVSQALAKRLEVNYDQLPLDQVVRDLQATLGVPVWLDDRALSDVGIALDVPVRFASSKVSARAAIGFMLQQLGLTTVIQHSVVMITTPEEAETIDVTNVYEVSDLVLIGDSSEKYIEPCFYQLIEILCSCVRPTTWGSMTGPGPIYPISVCGINAIVFSQMVDIHEDVELLLSHLRAVRHTLAELKNGTDTRTPCKPLSPPISPAERAIHRTLTTPVKL